MSLYDRNYNRMPDGTIKQINPFNNTEVWCVPERGRNNAVIVLPPDAPEPLARRHPEDYCHFCETQYVNCPPEKTRSYKDDKGKWKTADRLPAGKLDDRYAEFRRVGNLFEIVTYDYWVKNYGYRMSETNVKWMDSYLTSNAGLNHVLNVLRIKLEKLGVDFDSLSLEEKLERVEPFFGGCHELIIGKRHYHKNAKYRHDLASSGSLSDEEHYHYVKLVIEAMNDISEQNPYVRYISVFQNWLKPAGASFEHLHKQIVALDEWSVQMEREVIELRKNSNLYNEAAVNFSIYNDLMIAENDYAIAFAEIGHRFPTVAIYSKSQNSRPFEHTDKEVRGMSDLNHAIHRALGNLTSCNEEWYYAPFDSIYSMPWRILIKLRLHTPAGFEGNTKIYINPISPSLLRDELVASLAAKRDKGEIARSIRIGEEVSRAPNPLKYYLGPKKARLFE